MRRNRSPFDPHNTTSDLDATKSNCCYDANKINITSYLKYTQTPSITTTWINWNQSASNLNNSNTDYSRISHSTWTQRNSLVYIPTNERRGRNTNMIKLLNTLKQEISEISYGIIPSQTDSNWLYQTCNKRIKRWQNHISPWLNTRTTTPKKYINFNKVPSRENKQWTTWNNSILKTKSSEDDKVLLNETIVKKDIKIKEMECQQEKLKNKLNASNGWLSDLMEKIAWYEKENRGVKVKEDMSNNNNKSIKNTINHSRINVPENQRTRDLRLDIERYYEKEKKRESEKGIITSITKQKAIEMSLKEEDNNYKSRSYQCQLDTPNKENNELKSNHCDNPQCVQMLKGKNENKMKNWIKVNELFSVSGYTFTLKNEEDPCNSTRNNKCSHCSGTQEITNKTLFTKSSSFSWIANINHIQTIQTLQLDHNKWNAKIKELTSTLQELHTENNKLQVYVNNQKDEHERFHNEIMSKDNDIKVWKLNIQTLKNEIASAQENNARNEEAQMHQLSLFNALKEEYDKISKYQEDTKQNHSDINDEQHQEINANGLKQIDTLRKEINEKENTITEWTRKIKQCNENLIENTNKYNQIVIEIEHIQEETKNNKNKILEQDDTIEVLNKTIEKISNENSNLKTEIEHLSYEKHGQEAKIEEWLNELETRKATLNDVTEANNAKINEIKNQSHIISTQIMEIETKNTQINKWKECLIQLNKVNDEWNADAKDESNDLNLSLIISARESKATTNNHVNESSQKEEIDSLYSSIKECQNMIVALQGTIKEKDNEIEDYKTSNSKLWSTIAELKNKLNNNIVDYEGVRDDENEPSDASNNKQSSVWIHQINFDEEESIEDSEIDEWKWTIENLKETIVEKDKEIALLKQKSPVVDMNKMNTTKINDESNIYDSAEKIEQLKARVEHYKQCHQNEMIQNSMLKTEIKDWNQQIERYQSFDSKITSYNEFLELYSIAFRNYKTKDKEKNEAFQRIESHLSGYYNKASDDGKANGKKGFFKKMFK